MDFVGGLPTTEKGHDYIFVVVDKFNKMCILMPYKKTISGKEARNMFFEHVWVHFGIPKSLISEMDTKFISAFWTTPRHYNPPFSCKLFAKSSQENGAPCIFRLWKYPPIVSSSCSKTCSSSFTFPKFTSFKFGALRNFQVKSFWIFNKVDENFSNVYWRSYHQLLRCTSKEFSLNLPISFDKFVVFSPIGLSIAQLTCNSSNEIHFKELFQTPLISSEHISC
jgi:hypothetical protein